MKSRSLLVLLGIITFTALAVSSAFGQAQTYNSIPKPLPANVPSEGPEAYAFRELGDGLQLSPTEAGGTLVQVKVIMSSWACQRGHWYDGTCRTDSGATFSQPLTLNLYSVGNNNTVGSELGHFTQTFDIPYRPSGSDAKCASDPTAWYSAKEKSCFHGLAVPVLFNVADAHLVVPDKLIVTISFNTTTAGPAPLGPQLCNSASGGCPYDSLNIATFGVGGFDGDGSPLDFAGIFVNYISTANACPGTAAGSLVLDEGCWAGYHPEIHLLVNGSLKSNTKGNRP